MARTAAVCTRSTGTARRPRTRRPGPINSADMPLRQTCAMAESTRAAIQFRIAADGRDPSLSPHMGMSRQRKKTVAVTHVGHDSRCGSGIYGFSRFSVFTFSVWRVMASARRSAAFTPAPRLWRFTHRAACCCKESRQTRHRPAQSKHCEVID